MSTQSYDGGGPKQFTFFLIFIAVISMQTMLFIEKAEIQMKWLVRKESVEVKQESQYWHFLFSNVVKSVLWQSCKTFTTISLHQRARTTMLRANNQCKQRDFLHCPSDN